MAVFEYAIYGNHEGSHQLLETSLTGGEPLLEELRFLVDRPVGHVGAEVTWSPYWGCGPLRDWWVLWRGTEDSSAPRRNMVRSRVVMVRHEDVGSVDMEDLFEFLAPEPIQNQGLPVGTVISALSDGVRPVVVPDLLAAPALIAALWPRLWPAARRCFSLRTFFGSESLEFGSVPHVVVVPVELRPRWRSYTVVERTSQQPSTDATAWFSDAGATGLGRLLRVNSGRLPGDFSVLNRLGRISCNLYALQNAQAPFADALLVARTAEAFEGGLVLPQEDLDLLVAHLSSMRSATFTDVRAASLAKLTVIGESLPNVEMAMSRWIEEQLPAAATEEALWVLEQQAGSRHVAWWLRAVRTGLANAFVDVTSDWAMAIWRWWAVNPEAVAWTTGLLGSDSTFEASLVSHLPGDMSVDLQERITALCAERQWAKLLARSLRSSVPLSKAVNLLRKIVAEAEIGLDVLLEERRPGEVVTAAAEVGWKPLTERAVRWTLHDATLITGFHADAPGFLQLLARHLSVGGTLPAMARTAGFMSRVFDGCIDGAEHCADIVLHVAGDGAELAMVYVRQDALWASLGPGRRDPLFTATGAAWLKALIAGNNPDRPGTLLADMVQRAARTALHGESVGRVIDFLTTFPEVSEQQVVQWLASERFSWHTHDEDRLGELLVNRNWWLALESFEWSWKSELRAVAKHARRLLKSWDKPRTSPQGIDSGVSPTIPDWDKGWSGQLKILFLASNPTSQDRLAIDEEAREIEDKVRASKFRDGIEFRSKWAVRRDDLQQVLLEEEPTVVHFSGHGAGRHGIVLHSTTSGDETRISSATLAHLFKTLKDNIRVVVLNACYSEEQAARIVEEIDFVVGMADSIGDDAARVFAAAFYRGLGFGRTVQSAFDLGVNELHLMGLQEHASIPVLLTRKGADATAVKLMRPASA